MVDGLVRFGRPIVGTLRDLAPLVLVIALFQSFVPGQPFPDLVSVLPGLAIPREMVFRHIPEKDGG